MVFNAPSTCVRLGRQAVQLVRHGCQRSNDYPVGLSEWLGIVSHVVHGSGSIPGSAARNRFLAPELLLPFAPQPDSQSAEDDEGQSWARAAC